MHFPSCYYAEAPKTANKFRDSLSPCQGKPARTWPGVTPSCRLACGHVRLIFQRSQCHASSVRCRAATATHAGREGGLLQRKANQDACLAAVGFQGHAAQSLFGVFDGHGPVGAPVEWACASMPELYMQMLKLVSAVRVHARARRADMQIRKFSELHPRHR